jgi:L-ascorbate metabolism protein UlaG (beta-lactamase superfamily)
MYLDFQKDFRSRFPDSPVHVPMRMGQKFVYEKGRIKDETTIPSVEKGPLALTYVANCGVLVSSGETKVLIDALFDTPNPEYRAPAPDMLEKIMAGAPPFDGVDLFLVTHDHPDHFAAPLAIRYMEKNSGPVLLAPTDAVEAMRKAADDWPRIGARVVPLGLKVGEQWKRDVAGIPVTAYRTLHSGDRESPMNLMYLFEINGWRVFHEGDSTGKPVDFRPFGLGSAPVDLALVHYWFPLDPDCAPWLQKTLKPGHIVLTHLPLRLEGDAPGKIDQVRKYYKEIFLLMPGMPTKVFHWAGQAAQIPYLGQKPPGTKPQVFAPGIVSTDAHEFGGSFTPDGKEFYFTRRQGSQSPTLIMVSKFSDGVWTPPAPAAFNDTSGARPGGGMSFEPVVTPDGRRLYFSSDRPGAGGPDPTGMPRLNTWYVEREGDHWSAPKLPGPPFNPMKTMPISMTRTGTIYTADISEGMANNRISVSRLKDGAYQPLEALGAPINVGPINNYPHVAPDESYLIFNRRETPGGAGGLFISFRANDGTWGEPRPIDLGPLQAGQGMISPDGNYLFFTAGERLKADIYWVEAFYLKK